MAGYEIKTGTVQLINEDCGTSFEVSFYNDDKSSSTSPQYYEVCSVVDEEIYTALEQAALLYNKNNPPSSYSKSSTAPVLKEGIYIET